MVIVNPASGTIKAVDGDTLTEVTLNQIKKNYVIYMGDDAFWATEIGSDGKQKALWTNPTLVAKNGDFVRFNIIPIGTDLHEFILNGYSWFDPETSDVIDSGKNLGPLENYVFVVKANTGTTTYEDLQTSNDLMGMEGKFKVTSTGGASVPSPIPAPF
jgi:hypothetical protein